MFTILKQSNNIMNIEFSHEPQRYRKKNCGYMWKAEFDIYLKNGTSFSFRLWYNFLSEDTKWKPSLEMIYKYSRLLSIRWNNTYFDALSHIIRHDFHVYLSKAGYFHPFSDEIRNKKYNNIKQEIISGKWKQNNDIVLII